MELRFARFKSEAAGRPGGRGKGPTRSGRSARMGGKGCRGERSLFFGSGMRAVRDCHLVMGGTHVPRGGWEVVLGASAQFSSEGNQLKTGATECDVQMPLA